MQVYLERKDRPGHIDYDDVVAYDTYGSDEKGPVFLFILGDGRRVTHHKRDWYAFVHEWRELT